MAGRKRVKLTFLGVGVGGNLPPNPLKGLNG